MGYALTRYHRTAKSQMPSVLELYLSNGFSIYKLYHTVLVCICADLCEEYACDAPLEDRSLSCVDVLVTGQACITNRTTRNPGWRWSTCRWPMKLCINAKSHILKCGRAAPSSSSSTSRHWVSCVAILLSACYRLFVLLEKCDNFHFNK